MSDVQIAIMTGIFLVAAMHFVVTLIEKIKKK